MLIFISQSLVFILLFKVYAQRHHLLRASVLLGFKITVFFQTLIMYPFFQVFNRQYTKIFDILLKNAFEFFLPTFLSDIPFTLHFEVTLYQLQKFTILQESWTLFDHEFNNDFFGNNFFKIIFLDSIFVNNGVSSMLTIWSRPKSFSFLKFYIEII